MKFLIFSLSVLTTAHAWLFNGSQTYEFTTPTGLLVSPNYPNSYPTSMIYTYKITQPEGYIINLSISDINFGENDTDLNFTDRLTIFDGDREIFHRIDILSGSEYFFPARTYNSSTNHLLLQFKTFSNERQHRGFHATYQAIDVNCGGIVRSNNSRIAHSPSSKDDYNKNCNWIIEAPPAHVVNMTWTGFGLYPTDFLTIREWKDSNFEIMGNYTGQEMPEPLISTGPLVYINFKRVYPGAGDGFGIFVKFVNISNFSENNPTSIVAN